MVQVEAKIIKNIEVTPNCYKMVFEAPCIARQAQPGQFVNIRVSDKYEPLLRRPFSIHRIGNERRVTRNKVEILYEVVGQGTEILSQRKKGEYLDVIGPLGNGYSLRLTRYALLVAGGMGVAPLIFLAEKLAELKTQNSKFKISVLIGARTKKQLLCEREFERLGCEVKIATDDGSRGFKGFVSDLLKKELSTMDYRLSTIYACGPKQMLEQIAFISKQYKIPAQVSLEEHMACGIGACFGCVVNTKDGYKRICKDGPVFKAVDIKF